MDAIDALLAANGMTGKKKYGGTYLASVTTRDGITHSENLQTERTPAGCIA